ncbi:DUF429 domain-containing protein [Thiosulfativibrio zosterae]|uniref:DUF429 domain-containing protein n=1 Tax=Thiosulfativibrio zosterae TaxID=2675053 RepID=A0A6F8PPU0_9GAMM|nr:DUF429 domain-containing protein [Thiosulfativibrio zosterae]BBP44141.1 hypothetical protein THMIRHAT_18870 [Thiosulfativibrio zosterae]
MPKALYVGIDLAGPANFADTCMAIEWQGKLNIHCGCSDTDILKILAPYLGKTPVFIALDAPLTYQEGGGYRDVDRALRQHLNQHGFAKIGVMAPTMTKMVYLTLRGLRLKECLSALPQTTLFETHPGAALLFSGADYDRVCNIKSNPQALATITDFLKQQIAFKQPITQDHQAMAVAAMLSAKRAALGQVFWQFQSDIVGQPALVL